MKFFKTNKTKRIEHLEAKIQQANESILTTLDEILKMNKDAEKLSKEIEFLKERLEAAEENMDDYKRYREEKEMLKNSGEPWVDFETRVIDNDGRVEVKMDWNAEFIDYLKKEGFTASSDEELISIYFSSLVREAGDELSEEQAEKYM